MLWLQGKRQIGCGAYCFIREQSKLPFNAADAVLFGLGALFGLGTGRDEISGLANDGLAASVVSAI